MNPLVTANPRLFGYFFDFFFAFFFFGTGITSRCNVATAGLTLPTAKKPCQRGALDNEMTHGESTKSGLELRDFTRCLVTTPNMILATESILGRNYVFVIVRSFASSRYLSADDTESLSYIRHCENDGCFCRSL